MFGDLDSCVQRIGRVVRQDRDFALSNDVTAIDGRIHIVDSAAGNVLSRKQRLLPSLQALGISAGERDEYL